MRHPREISSSPPQVSLQSTNERVFYFISYHILYSCLQVIYTYNFANKTGRTFGFDWQNGCLSPFECAPKSLISKALEAARIGSGDYVAELGCGDGRVALQAESLGATVLGVELSGDLLLQAIRRRKESRRNGADFLQQDIRQLDFRHFTVLVVFLLPAALDAPWLSDMLLGAVEAGVKGVVFCLAGESAQAL